MYIQGNLQTLFDALYQLGVIDPVIEMDWKKAMKELPLYQDDYLQLVNEVNDSKNDLNNLISKMKNYNEKTLCFLAIEVAREFADYHSRETLH